VASVLEAKSDHLIKKIFIILSFLWCTYHLIATRYFLLAPARHNNLHLICGIALIYLIFLFGIVNGERKKGWKVKAALDTAMFALLLLSAIYIHTQYLALSMDRQFTQTAGDITIGIFIIVAVLYFTWRKWGAIIPLLSVIALFYLRFGSYFSAGSVFYHSDVSIKRMIAMQTTFFTGIYGSLLATSATVLIVYIIFGAVLTQMGALKMIMDVIRLFAGDCAAAAVQLTAVGSAAFGTISGASAANVAVTGAVTIPLMKERGVKPDFAAAISSVASCGGGIMPPIMAAAAFLLASLAGVSYFDVVIVAVIPAILYYGAIMLQGQLHCNKYGLSKKTCNNKNKLRELLQICGKNLFVIIPFLALIYFMAVGVSVTMTGLYAILLVFLVRYLHYVFLDKEKPVAAVKRLFEDYWKAMTDASETMCSVTIIMACLGMFVEAIVGTGIGNRLSFSLVEMANGNIYILLVVMAVVCLFLGCGLPTIPSYLLVAIVGAPALEVLGIPLVLGHFFILYYANLSQITPPVGITSLVASKLAGTSYAKTGLRSVVLAIPIFVIPMLFVIFTGLGGLKYSQNGFLGMLFDIGMALICLIPLCFACEGFIFTKLHVLTRILLIVPTFLVFTENPLLILVGLGIDVSAVALNYFRSKKSGAERYVKAG